MRSIRHLFGDLTAAVDGVGAVDWASESVDTLLGALDQLETVRRRAAALVGDLAVALEQHTRAELGGVCHKVIADVVRITPAEARRRLRDAAQLQPRTTLTGESLAPELPATAKAWAAGLLDPEHLRAIQSFMNDLPEDLPPAVVEHSESFLAEKATELRPDQLHQVANRLAASVNPDGLFSESLRTPRRGFTWGPQRPDGLSRARLTATPELRAMLDAWFARFAAPGMANPDDQTPTITTQPSDDTADRDARSHPQRQHDALALLVRSQLGNPALGTHRGLPVTVVVTATLDQLHTAAGVAVTDGGTLLPIPDLIRMATHAHHYLCIFDTHHRRPLYLGRTKRIATSDQRLVLHARDRGCTAPGCTAPGYLSEVHHITDWAHGGTTNIDNLTFACRPHHRLLTPGGWTTRKLPTGQTQWIPPPHLPIPAGTNAYHHPEHMLPGDTA
jgi:hypothetical protein